MKKIKNELIELRNAVNDSAQLTNNQLSAIKFDNPLIVIISLGISVGLAYWLRVAIYWVPASFLIMYLWSLKGLVSSQNSFKPEQAERSLGLKKLIKPKQINLAMDCFMLNLSSFAKATAIIYGVSLFILLAINQTWIESTTKLPILWPILSMIIYLPLPFLLKGTSNFLKKIINQPWDVIDKVKKNFGMSGLNIFLGILRIVFIIVVIIGSLLAPVIALIQTLGLIDDWLFFAIVVISQFVSIIIISSYYSKLTVSKQLSNAMTNYADINYQINYLLLYKKADEQKLKQLKRLYLLAKPFEIEIDNSMQFIQFYALIINRTFWDVIAED